MASVLDVGQVVRQGLPGDEFLSKIERLLDESVRDFAAFAEAAFDERMTLERWTRSLRMELLLLYKWAIRRHLVARHDVHAEGLVSVDDHVVVLLPSYGFALHALRRAVPFAALGMRVTVSVPAHVLADARGPLMSVASSLGLTSTLIVDSASAPALVERSVNAGSPIFVTGRRATVDHLKMQYPAARIYGATGTCSVIVSRDFESASRLEHTIRGHELSVSCSNHGLSVVYDGSGDTATVVRAWGRALQGQTASQLGDRLSLVHPSVVLAPADEAVTAGEHLLSGYTLWNCDSDGEPERREGFARDPRCGWPGDYCV